VTGDLHPHVRIEPLLRQPGRGYRDGIEQSEVQYRMLAAATVTAQNDL
jgi:hypothetical protein